MEDYAARLDDRAAELAQEGRQHILMVNRDPALLDIARVLLADSRYNVTSTNAVPLTFALIAAARPALLIVDLAITELAGWDLLIRLHTEARTAAIPVIITAHDPRLLDHAARYPYLYGQADHLAVPFAVDTLLAAVRKLIGAA